MKPQRLVRLRFVAEHIGLPGEVYAGLVRPDTRAHTGGLGLYGRGVCPVRANPPARPSRKGSVFTARVTNNLARPLQATRPVWAMGRGGGGKGARRNFPRAEGRTP